MTTKKAVTLSAAALLAGVVQMTARAIDLPANVPADAVYLTSSDSSSYFSLTTDYTKHHWSDGNSIKETDTEKNYYIPPGLTANATNGTQTIVPKIYCAGRVSNGGLVGNVFTFNNLFLLEGGEIYQKNIGPKAGRITILSEDAEHPALLSYARSGSGDYPWRYPTYLRACVVGSKDSQFLYQMGGLYPGFLKLQAGSDWSGFEGTLRIADGLGIANIADVPVSMPGAVRFGRDGILMLTESNASYSFGELSFVEDGSITNTGSGATLTVAGTFDTGTNCYWYSKNPGTFGTLILGDRLTLINDQTSPEIVFTVTNRLEVGRKITVEYTKVPNMNGATPAKVLLMRLAPEAVAAGVPDLSGVTVIFKNGWPVGYLTTEEDQENVGGLLVYATQDPIVYYNGPDEWSVDTSERGTWLNSSISPTFWDDGLYPDGEKVYCTTQGLYTSSTVTTFPGKTLVCASSLYIGTSVYVTNLYLTGALYGRANVHIRGNLTPIGTRRVRQLGYRTFYLDSTLHGSGSLYFNSYYPEQGKGGGTFYLTADNSDWTGSWYTTWTEQSAKPLSADETYHTRVIVGDAKALGGNPKTFKYDAQKLTDYAELRFTNTTVQTASNRGFYVTNGILRVDQGATADLTAPVTMNGTLRKFGAGTLGFGGGIRWAANNDLTDTTAPAEGENVVLVKEGAIKGGSLAQAVVTFSDGAGIAADAASGAMDLTGATVTAEGTICLSVDVNKVPKPTEEVSYPVVKVSSAQNATLGPAFAAAKTWKGWAAKVVSESDGEGNVVYSVKYWERGTTVLIR